MPARKNYNKETMARAVRMYRDRLEDGGIRLRDALEEVGQLLGVNPSALRNWIHRDDGRNGVTTAAGAAGGEPLAE